MTPDEQRKEPNIEQWIRSYNDKTRQQFNPDLFYRDDEEIVESLKKVILSCQRNSYFTIKVEGFETVTDYDKIIQVLYEHEQEKINRNKNNKKIDNPYSFINIKDSDIILLIVYYYVSVNDGIENPSMRFRVVIEIPKVVEKYYYRIGGNLYSAIYQIVDGSTYNNSSSNSKKQSVTSKTIFMPIRLYRQATTSIKDYNGIPHKLICYQTNLFGKKIDIMTYYLAKLGLYDTIDFFEFRNVIKISDTVYDDPDWYTFTNQNNNLIISVPKIILDSDQVIQSFVATLYRHFEKIKGSIGMHDLLTREHWVEKLAECFTVKAYIDKGYSVLDSFESILDIETRESLRLPEVDKKDIYTMVRWMIREFPNLRLKDITDISTKKIRRPDYMSANYAVKLSKGIYRASDTQRAITVQDLRRYIYVEPDFLMNKIVKDKLVSFRNGVNDNDAVNALKFSYKGISGLGDQTNSSIPIIFRQVHHSHHKRVDPDTSSATDPGLTGIICPMAPIYNKSFSEYDEPNSWRDEYSQVIENYRSTVSKKQLITFQNELGGFAKLSDAQMDALQMSLDTSLVAMQAMDTLEQNTEYCAAEMDENGEVSIYQYEFDGGEL